MNILFLSSWYPTKSNPNFGIFVKEHAHAIQLKNNIVVLACVINKTSDVFSKTITDTIDESGMRTVLIEINTRFNDILHYILPLQYLIINRIFRKNIATHFTPDIVHSNVIFPSGIIGNYLSLRIKKPHIITEHWSRIEGLLNKPVLSDIAVNSYKNASRILPVSEFLMNRMKTILPTVEVTKFRVVGNVIDSEQFHFKAKKRIDNSLRFCAIAAWSNKKIPDKKPELFIEALSLLQKQINQTIILTMIGDGDKVIELQDLCNEKGIHADFTGYLDKPEIAKILQSTDFFIHASTIETFGIVIAEALLCGTPVICSNVGALPELINKSNGILCENTIDGWVSGLHKIVSCNFYHAEIAGSIQQKFSKENISRELNEIYLEVIER